MNKPLTYVEACNRHPNEVVEIIAEIRKGRTKDKVSDPSTWKWSYSWCEEIECDTLGELLSGSGERRQVATRKLTLAQRIDKALDSCHVSLNGSCRSRDVSTEVLRDIYTESVTAQVREEERVAALSPQQNRTELDNSIRELSKMPGFFAIRLG